MFIIPNSDHLNPELKELVHELVLNKYVDKSNPKFEYMMWISKKN